jgi:hypothetical protein
MRSRLVYRVVVVVVLNARRGQTGADASAVNRESNDTRAIVELGWQAKALATEEYVRQLVDSAPPLTVEQKSRLAAILVHAVESAAADQSHGDAA